MVRIFRGVFPPAITPFTKDEEIDEGKLTEFLDFLIGKGVHGIFLLGTNSEAPLLTFEEKKRVMEIAVNHVSGRVPVIVGVGSVSTKETVELAKYAEKVGADAIHVVTPYYYPVTKEGLIRHYRRVAESVELPVMLYNIPSLTGNRIPVDAVVELAKIENVAGLKDSSRDVAWFREVVVRVSSFREDFSPLCGSDAVIFPYLMLGATGAVSAVANAFPEVVVELYESFARGDLVKAKEMQDKVLEIRKIMKEFPFMSAVKGALKVRGYDFGPLRSPLHTLSEEELKKLEARLKAVGVI